MSGMEVLATYMTADGRYVIYLLPRQRAEVASVEGRARITVFGPAPLYRVTDRLVELGYDEDDLQPE